MFTLIVFAFFELRLLFLVLVLLPGLALLRVLEMPC